MPDNSLLHNDLGDEIQRLLQDGGGPATPNVVDAREMTASALIQAFRGQISAAVQQEKVGVRELARALEVSAAQVSRFLRSEGDLHVSTAALLAEALGRKWKLELVRKDSGSTNSGPNVVVTAEAQAVERYLKPSVPFTSTATGV